ncbi:unnamed protein product [Rotaria sp. Silwood2]|nr:unnamed protein product [Rotaria sp. Silwood2]CAF2668124.1 unnamed protein product [Rotaria sp. Silwood2]CAF2857527.1 unnamed protein product [Rotaria sp. Silwood2]CAF3102560.1 unnamed protein product [Rotaria sp. Silwood2]CAF4118723.1 unnamed protein product [Rotaria sp. Silwood2]
MKMVSERLHNASMLLLVHIYLQWTSLIEILAKKESGLSTVNKIQMYSIDLFVFYFDNNLLINIRESVTQRLRDPLLLGSAIILAASKCFVME